MGNYVCNFVLFHFATITATNQQITSDQFQQSNNTFKHYGLKDKISHLNNDFDIKIPQSNYLISINQARNCMTHRRGIVGSEDCIDSKELIVKWNGIDVYAETPSGEKISLLNIPKGGVELPEGSKGIEAFPERIRNFTLGTLVNFSPRDLAEICRFTLIQSNEVIKATEEYAIKKRNPNYQSINIC